MADRRCASNRVVCKGDTLTVGVDRSGSVPLAFPHIRRYANRMAVVHITAPELREIARDPDGTYAIHRHTGDHEHGVDCWCYPLCLTADQVTAHNIHELQLLLDTHYRIQ